MSAGSGASNMGYSNISPFFGNSINNVNYVNSTNSHNPASFSSNVIPTHGLVGARSNVNAAAGIIGGSSRIIKNKIKNITKKYKKMGKKSYKMRSIKRRKSNLKRRNKSKRNNYKQKGGAQFLNNTPFSTTISTPGNSGITGNLANPVSYKILPTSGQCIDNYNHYTGRGFSSKN